MSTKESSSNSICDEEMYRAERGLAAFISAVTELFGAEQARLSAEGWLDELELMDSPPRSTSRDWRVATVAASARLAHRLNTAMRGEIYSSSSTDTKVSPIPSSDCSGSTLLL